MTPPGRQRADAASLVESARRHYWLAGGAGDEWYERDAVVVVEAGGPYFVDATGTRLLDALCVQSAGILGHNHPRVLEAMARQMRTLTTNVGGMLPSNRGIELGERLAELTEGQLTRTLYAVSGAEANDAAIRLARQYWKNVGRGTKYKTIVRRHGYHGGTLATSAASGNNRYPHSAYEPLPHGFVHVESPYPRACQLCEGGDCSLACAEEVRRAIEYEDAETVACVLAEPTMAVAGIVPPPAGYFKRLREICDDHDVLLIVDEVVTAMGRTGHWFEYQREGIVPDVVILAKVLTAGHVPLGALVAKETVAQEFQSGEGRQFIAASTLAGTPLACAAALTVLDVVAEERLSDRSLEIERRAAARLNDLRRQCPILTDVRIRGAMMAVEWRIDESRGRPAASLERIKRRAVELGREARVHFFGGPSSSLAAIPPSNISDAALEHLLSGFEEVVHALNGEFFV